MKSKSFQQPASWGNCFICIGLLPVIAAKNHGINTQSHILILQAPIPRALIECCCIFIYWTYIAPFQGSYSEVPTALTQSKRRVSYLSCDRKPHKQARNCHFQDFSTVQTADSSLCRSLRCYNGLQVSTYNLLISGHLIQCVMLSETQRCWPITHLSSPATFVTLKDEALVQKACLKASSEAQLK